MLTIDLGTPEDVADLALRITDDDAAELRAAGLDVATALCGANLQALRWRGSLVCIFGCAAHPTDRQAGIPWMLCTTTLQDVPRVAMARVSKRVVTGWRHSWPVLANLVHRRHARALAFVSWLGFDVGGDPMGPGGEFFLFSWSRTNV